MTYFDNNNDNNGLDIQDKFRRRSKHWRKFSPIRIFLRKGIKKNENEVKEEQIQLIWPVYNKTKVAENIAEQKQKTYIWKLTK